MTSEQCPNQPETQPNLGALLKRIEQLEEQVAILKRPTPEDPMETVRRVLAETAIATRGRRSAA